MNKLSQSPAIRLATVDDTEAITHLRWQLMMATGRDEDTATRNVYGVNYQTWLRRHIGQGSYIGWLAENETPEIVAMVGLWLNEWQPTLTTPDEQQGYVVNVFTAEAYRGQGIGRKLMVLLLDECRNRNLKKVSLHASVYGQPLYESLGFKSTNEMRLEL